MIAPCVQLCEIYIGVEDGYIFSPNNRGSVSIVFEHVYNITIITKLAIYCRGQSCFTLRQQW